MHSIAKVSVASSCSIAIHVNQCDGQDTLTAGERKSPTKSILLPSPMLNSKKASNATDGS